MILSDVANLAFAVSDIDVYVLYLFFFFLDILSYGWPRLVLMFSQAQIYMYLYGLRMGSRFAGVFWIEKKLLICHL